MINKIFSKKINGKANPKKAGSHTKTGGMYFAATATSKLTMVI